MLSSNRDFFRQQLSRNDLVAAPMAGVSTPPFRKILRDYFDGIAYTEMVSVEGVCRDNPASTIYLDMMEGDRPVVAQLFGGNSAAYAPAIAVAEAYNGPDAFDINMGCPVKKVIKSGGGCALLLNLENVAQIVRAVRQATERPFSVKIRIGWEESKPVYREILDIAQSEGADAIILHARTRTQMFGGAIHYEALAEMAANATIPVIGNGDVCDYASYKRMKDTGVDGVMIGRAMMHAPWVFQAIREQKATQGFISPSQIHALLLKLLDYSLLHAGTDMNKLGHYLNLLRKQAVWFSKGLPDAAQFRVEVFRGHAGSAEVSEGIAQLVDTFKFFKQL
ncbi:MAG: tRNA-dihydrouridine synthase family protein [Deferribacteraceae bacterium]|jgi:nifR3 family TIM-barrel protein|nr:tRNA-dihydrouridine synthase family protein [Deferribacteraceae bacterium]